MPFQIYQGQSSTLYTHFFRKMFFVVISVLFWSTMLFLHIYHVVTGGEIYDRPENLANHFLLYVNKVIFAYL